jgi:asparagine synthetase B (glutamine-hydrolysing)
MAASLFRYYSEFGDELLTDVDGAFALVVVDRRQRRAVVATDPFGVTAPFYVQVPGGGFACSSNINALAAYPGLSTDLDRVAMAERCVFGFHDTGRTFVSAIRQPRPGTSLEFALDQPGPPLARPISKVTPEESMERRDIDAEEWLEEVRLRLLTSLRKRVHGTRRSVIALSGGVDSSLLATLQGEVDGKGLVALTLTDPDSGAREDVQYASLVAASLRLRHLIYSVPHDIFCASVPAIIWIGGANGLNIAPYFLARAVRDLTPEAPLVLCGEGAEDYPSGLVDPQSVDLLSEHYRTGHLGAEFTELDNSTLYMLVAKHAAAAPGDMSASDEFLRIRRTANFYAYRSTADACGVTCSFPYVDPHVSALMRVIPKRLREHLSTQNFLLKLLLLRHLPDEELAVRLLRRPKQPLFIALSNSIWSLGKMLQEHSGLQTLQGSRHRRYARDLIELFWISAFDAMLVEKECDWQDVSFDDLVELIRRNEQRVN